MKMQTKHFGEIDIDPNNIIIFKEGLPGFEQIRKMIVINHPDEDTPFQWLQSVDEPQITFVIIDPRVFFNDYIVNISESDVAALKIEDPSDVLIFSLVVVPEEVTNMTANLKAPILINIKNNTGKQVVLEEERYPLKYYILQQQTGGK